VYGPNNHEDVLLSSGSESVAACLSIGAFPQTMPNL